MKKGNNNKKSTERKIKRKFFLYSVLSFFSVSTNSISPIQDSRPFSVVPVVERCLEIEEAGLKREQITEKFKDVVGINRGGALSFREKIAFFAAMWAAYVLQSRVEGLSPIRPIQPPHERLWGDNSSGNQRPHVNGYSSSSAESKFKSTSRNKNNWENKLTGEQVRNFYKKMPDLTVELEGKTYKITAWAAAKHAHHSPSYQVYPEDYGLTYTDLENLSEKRLVRYINEGNPRPNEAYVRDLQESWKNFVEDKNNRIYPNTTVMGRKCLTVVNLESRIFLSFTLDNNESFTGYKLRPKQFDRYTTFQIIGKNYNNNK